MSVKITPKTLFLQDDLTSVDLEHYRQSGIVAVDCEMTGLNPHRDVLCLVQMCSADGYVRLVKTHDWRESAGLKAFFQDAQVLKIFHFAIMDCGFILKSLGVEVQNVFCTKIASKLARTYTGEHSLMSLVKELMGVEMNKSEQSTFWLSDKLTEKQLSYAAHDVTYLIEARELLLAMLHKKGDLPTGISYIELNQYCQNFIPTLVQLWINGWDFGREEKSALAIFGR